MPNDNYRLESREECLDWFEKEWGKDTRRVIEAFINYPGNHPFEERRDFMKELWNLT